MPGCQFGGGAVVVVEGGTRHFIVQAGYRSGDSSLGDRDNINPIFIHPISAHGPSHGL